MDSYLMSYLLPVLSVLTIIFIIMAIISISSSRKTARHLETTASHFGYTRKSLNSVQSGITGINTKIDEHLMPALKEMYKNVGAGGILIEPNNIIRALGEIGFDSSQVITEEGNLIGTGIDTGDEKVTYFFYMDDNQTELVIMSFSIEVESPSEAFMSDLMVLNSSIKYGCIGFRKFGNRNVLIVDQSVRAREKRIDKDELKEYIGILAALQFELIKLAEKRGEKYREILMSEYAKLASENKEQVALVDGAADL